MTSTIQTVVDPKVKEAVKAAAEKLEMTSSQLTRRFIKKGLKEMKHETDT